MRFGLKYHEIYYKKGIYWPLTSLAFYSFINGKFMKSEGLFRTALMMLDTVKEILFFFFFIFPTRITSKKKYYKIYLYKN
jgi:hypothetical protein